MYVLLSSFVDTPAITRAAPKLFGQPATTSVSESAPASAPASVPASASNTSFCVSETTTKAVPKRTPTQKQKQLKKGSSKPNLFKEKLVVIPEDLICCDIKFTQISSYKRHISREHPKDVFNDGVGCMVCGKVFLPGTICCNTKNLINEKKNKKTKQKFICDNCKTSYTKKTSLIRHFSNKSC